MAFDLVQYFAEQIKIQKPELLSQYSDEERLQYLSEANTLSLGKLITLMRQDGTKLIKRFKLRIISIFKNLQGISPRLRKMNHS